MKTHYVAPHTKESISWFRQSRSYHNVQMNYLRYAVNRGGSGDGTSSLLHDVFARSAKWASLKYSAIDRERFLQAFRVEVNPDIIFSQKLPGECHVEAAVYIPKLVSVINTTVDVADIDTVRLNVLVDRWGNIFVENPAPVKEGRLKEAVKLPYKLTDQEWGIDRVRPADNLNDELVAIIQTYTHTRDSWTFKLPRSREDSVHFARDNRKRSIGL